MDRALRIVEVLGRLTAAALGMLRRGEYERIDKIVPSTLLSDLEYAEGAARARAKLPSAAERDDS
jgi:hypothetical protein